MKTILFTVLLAILFSSMRNRENNLPEVDGSELMIVVEKMPTFPGGEAALGAYLKAHAIYTEKAKVDSASGRVFVQFAVEKDGSLTDVKVVRSLHRDLDRVALDMIRKMPLWEPGEQRGKAVRVEYMLPVEFKIENTQDLGSCVPSKYWKNKGYKELQRRYSEKFTFDKAEFEACFRFVICNYNKNKLDELNSDEIFRIYSERN